MSNNMRANKLFYKKAIGYGMVCRCISLSEKASKNKKIYHCTDKFYDDNKNIIKYESEFDSSKNCVQVLTGKLHGGFIGIDIDIKGQKPQSHDVYIDKLNDVGQWCDTMT